MRKWWPLVAVSLGAFILLVDVTIVNVALPSMADDLDASFSSLQWVVDAYALSLAALLLAAGSAADLFGHRRLYVLGLAAFALASLGCGLAPDAWVLVAARAVQGAGGAAMFATSAALLGATYHGRDRGTAFGVWGAVNGAAAAAGPVLGGLLTEHIGWQAIFLVNLPVAAVAIWLTLRVIRADRTDAAGETAGKRGRMDAAGAVTFTLAAASVTYALIRSTEDGWTSATVLTAFAVAAAALVAFVLAETRLARRGGPPLLDLGLLRRPAFAGLMGGALLFQGGAFGCLVLVSLWLQSVLGLGPVAGGVALMPMAVLSFLVAAVAGRHVQRVAPRLPIGAGLLLVAAGMYLLYDGMSADAGRWSLAAGLAVAGAGVGLSTPVLVSAATGSVPPQRMGMAAGAVNTFRQLGMTLFIAVLGAVFTHTARTELAGAVPDAHAAASALAGGQAQRLVAAAPQAHRATAEDLVHRAFAAGLQDVFLWSAGAAVAGAVLVLALVRPARPRPAAHPAAGEPAAPAKEPARKG
ncbi:MFS transporter [Streptomyces caatingaensis]|uniref:Multidrug MFS transporter n=1 Tax=Streptomyces caatingaensis TaxID=1678637 RepID=A0A0K9XLA9_9ACTN|nr:MFS transporter [Streptomyces caatingaensis]KNB54135.1 multidrug MFS transporter [Streptomyces caatingaensis]